MGKFHQFLTELSACNMSIFSFLDDNLRVNFNGFSPNMAWAFILQPGLELLMSQFCQFFGRVTCPQHIVFSFQDNNLSKSQRIFTVNLNGFSPNLTCALILWRSGLGLLLGTFLQS